MNTTTDLNLSADGCIRAMETFWREQVQAAPTRDGIALALPLMYPDGWQVAVHLSQPAPGWVRLSDQGKTLGMLTETGLGIDARHTGALLADRVKAFELKHDDAVITKDVRLPLQGVDVQLFAEALVSIAHLIYRHEPPSLQENPADKAVLRIMESRKIHPRRNVEIEGRLERRIRVDYLVEARQPLAVQVVHRRDNLLGYMEQWAFRWSDLKRHNKQLVAAMVYNPENQDWDPTALRIGSEVCDVFCRYDDSQALNSILDTVGA